MSICSVNLMASLGSLSAIARQRPAFMSIVVQAFESLHGRCIHPFTYSGTPETCTIVC